MAYIVAQHPGSAAMLGASRGGRASLTMGAQSVRPTETGLAGKLWQEGKDRRSAGTA